MSKFIFTCGDVNGIGPEIVIKSLNRIAKGKSRNQFIFICPENIFIEASKTAKPKFDYEFSNSIENYNSKNVVIIPLKKAKQKWGSPSKEAGLTAYNSIKLSFELLIDKKADAVITAPISKTSINLAGINFPGHTEMYADWCRKKIGNRKKLDFAMMFLSKKMNAALITIHNPIKSISSLLNKELLTNKLNVIINSLKYDLNVKSPKIAVLGLNPHAGENGLIGNEEKNIITPVIKKLQSHVEIKGPFVPDAFFANHSYKKFDIVVGMYHDQVLIPFKMLNFSSGVNFTAGLPIVRTSPDHGTAFDIAGKNLADEFSILEAYYYADKIVKNRIANAKQTSH